MIKRILPLALLSLAFAASLRAQIMFIVVLADGRVFPVSSAIGVTPKVFDNGKWVEVYTPKEKITKRASAYADGFVKFTDFRIDALFDEGGSPMENMFKLEGVAVSDRSLKNCYLLFEFQPDPGNAPTLVTAALPDLDAGVSTQFRLRIPQDPTLHLQERNYTVHFFSGVREHATSEMDETDQKIALDHTDSAILARTENRPLKPLLRARPERPANVPDDMPGAATVRCVVGYDGLIESAAVVSCSAPAFGDAALDAIRQWIFIPAIKNHVYVKTTVDIPLQFKAAAHTSAPAFPAPTAPAIH
jgi:TonB family protein